MLAPNNIDRDKVNLQDIKCLLYHKQYDVLEEIATLTRDKKIKDIIYRMLSNHSTREKNYQQSNHFIKKIADPQVSDYAIKFQVLSQLKDPKNKPSAEQIKEFITKAEKLSSAYSDEIYYEIIQDSKDFELCSQLEDRIKGEEYKDKAVKRNVSYFAFNNLQRCMDLKEKYSNNIHHKDCVLSAIASYHKKHKNLQEAILEALQISSESLKNQLLGDIAHYFCQRLPSDAKEKVKVFSQLKDVIKHSITSHSTQSKQICDLLMTFGTWIDKEKMRGISKDLYLISKSLILEIAQMVDILSLKNIARIRMNGQWVSDMQELLLIIMRTLDQSQNDRKIESNSPKNASSVIHHVIKFHIGNK